MTEDTQEDTDTHTLILWIFSIIIISIGIALFWMAYKNPIQFSILEHDLMEDSKGYDESIWQYVSSCGSIDVENQAKCVTENLRPIIRYNGSNYSDEVKSFEKFFNTGGTCKEIAVSYASAMRQLQWNIRFRSPVPKHISITASKQTSDNVWIFCDMELNKVNCVQIDNTRW